MSGRTVKSRTRLSSHLSVCGGASVHLNVYPERSPILTLTTGDVSVTIAMSNTDLDATAMQFVRELADAAARFAEDCTRFALNADPAAELVHPPTGLAAPSSAGRSRGSRAA
ncbi:hypothetical protein I6A60_13650 [Frankia sp. AgB1.9]|uniref:hypothetical protein n=1 Tax=unclassified Frankia TaxID=2632575 RepID=UPI001932B5E6|nr:MULTISPECIES: hypothetical protein [unclassified Frankia]MBL7487618.1 hypothetical protein [Frankia sp. AgW1.1]MBL7548916.1 hypothetical protein [Frankia sp. AgB1.9]MBL7624884.1 hypothetical protein [Frankia sp. AgB1.8]